MEYNDLINFPNYAKSKNQKITWRKKDNINLCDLNSNCMEITFNLKKDNNIIINNSNNIYEDLIFDKLHEDNPIPIIDNIPFDFENFSKIKSNYFQNYVLNYDLVTVCIVVLFIFVLIYRKNY